MAFLYLCVKSTLDLDEDEALDSLTEGGGDFGVDAFHATVEADGEFTVTLFQAKYKAKLEGDANFPVAGINAFINAIRHVFDPSSTLGAINDRLRAKVEQARSMIRDGAIPVGTVLYNHKITVSGIPLAAYEYVVSGKTAIDWVMERQCVKTDKDSGIVNDANE